MEQFWRKHLLDRYDLADTPALDPVLKRAGRAKAPLAKALGLVEGRRQIELSNALGHQLVYEITSTMAESIMHWRVTKGLPTDCPLTDFLQWTQEARKDEHTGQVYYDPHTNTTISGTKFSKTLIRMLREENEASGFWDNVARYQSASYRKWLPKLPMLRQKITPEVFVQNLLSELADLKSDCIVSVVFDDFPNSAETDAFNSCFSVGGKFERAPFQMALGTNTAVILFRKAHSPTIRGRAWLLVDLEKQQLGVFGDYGVDNPVVYSMILDEIQDVLGWTDAREYEGFRGTRLSSATPDQWPDEFHGLVFNPLVVFRAVRPPMDGLAQIDDPHMPCPVCGGVTEDHPSRIVCEACCGPAASPSKYALVAWHVTTKLQ